MAASSFAHQDAKKQRSPRRQDEWGGKATFAREPASGIIVSSIELPSFAFFAPWRLCALLFVRVSWLLTGFNLAR
jgi:hypothetical protein